MDVSQKKKVNVPPLDDIYNAKIDNKYTFYGFLLEYYDVIFSRVKEDETKRAYNSRYNNLLLPHLRDLILETCEREDFDQVIEECKKHRDYAESTLKNLRYLLRTVVSHAAKKGICEDVLFGTIYSIPQDEQQEDIHRKEFVKNRKSLKAREEHLLFDNVMVDYRQDGPLFGLALMFALGLRNNEACGVKFSAFRPMKTHPGRWCLWIYESTVGETNDLKAGGKTTNAPRILPVPSKLLHLILLRKKHLQELLDNGSISLDSKHGQKSVDDLPVVCQKSNYTKHCSSKHLTKAGCLLLKEIQVKEIELSYIERDLLDDEYCLEMGVTEKDPTAYLLRRNLGTHLYLLGLTAAEIQYIMGHDIQDLYTIRNDFENEDLLYKIALKMDNRPLFNDSYPHEESLVLSAEAPVQQCWNTHEFFLQFPSSPNKVFVRMLPHAPSSPIQLELKSSSPRKPVSGILRILPKFQEIFSRTVNILRPYQRYYEKPPSNEY